MRDINYGFEAIKPRYAVLGGDPISIPDENKIDLARLLIEKYGVKYIGHPRMEKLIQKNKMSTLNFLTGKDEAQAFENKEYVKLHQSTLKKVDLIDNILKRAAFEDLKINSSLREIYGISFQGLYELSKENWKLFIAITIIIWIMEKLLSYLSNEIITMLKNM